MSDQEQKPIDQSNYIKKRIAKLITFQLDETSKNRIKASIPKNTEDQKISAFIEEIQLKMGEFEELTRQRSEYATEPNKSVTDKIKKASSNIKNLTETLDEIAQSDEILNRLHIILRSSISHEDEIKAMNNGTYYLLKNIVNDTLIKLKQDLTNLNDHLIIADQLNDKGNSGRPSKDLRTKFIRQLAEIHQHYIGKPTLTRDGPFESIVETCLNVTGEYISDIHSLILDSLNFT